MFFNSPTGFSGRMQNQMMPQPNPLMQTQVMPIRPGPSQGQGFHPGMTGQLRPQVRMPGMPGPGLTPPQQGPGMLPPGARPFPGQGHDMMPMGPMTNPGMAGGDPQGAVAQGRPMMPQGPMPSKFGPPQSGLPPGTPPIGVVPAAAGGGPGMGDPRRAMLIQQLQQRAQRNGGGETYGNGGSPY